MLQAFGDNAKCERLHAGNGFIAVRAVTHHPGQSRHFSQPPTITLPLKFDREQHRSTVAPA